jgi:release factor glutamine methyltransferase
MNLTFYQILRKASQRLASHSDSAQFDAELLLAHVIKKERSYFYTWPERQMNNKQSQQFEKLIQQREQGQPIAYILGQQAFWTLNLKVSKDTLIPRPETELLIETVLDYYARYDALSILDLGTGTGAIALAIADEFPQSQILAVDISAEALKIAQYNAAHYQLSHVQFLQSDWFSNIPAQGFDCILSNPPYIDVDDPHLQQGDVRYEPRLALHSGAEGFKDIQHIVQHSPAYLKPHGYLMFEHGYQQASTARHYLAQAHFENIQSLRDLAGHERISIGRMK